MGDSANDFGVNNHVQIDVSGCEKCTCLMCGKCAMDDTPLLSIVTSAASGGKRPWGKYKTIHHEDPATKQTLVHRKPVGERWTPENFDLVGSVPWKAEDPQAEGE